MSSKLRTKTRSYKPVRPGVTQPAVTRDDSGIDVSDGHAKSPPRTGLMARCVSTPNLTAKKVKSCTDGMQYSPTTKLSLNFGGSQSSLNSAAELLREHGCLESAPWMNINSVRSSSAERISESSESRGFGKQGLLESGMKPRQPLRDLLSSRDSSLDHISARAPLVKASTFDLPSVKSSFGDIFKTPLVHRSTEIMKNSLSKVTTPDLQKRSEKENQTPAQLVNVENLVPGRRLTPQNNGRDSPDLVPSSAPPGRRLTPQNTGRTSPDPFCSSYQDKKVASVFSSDLKNDHFKPKTPSSFESGIAEIWKKHNTPTRELSVDLRSTPSRELPSNVSSNHKSPHEGRDLVSERVAPPFKEQLSFDRLSFGRSLSRDSNSSSSDISADKLKLRQSPSRLTPITELPRVTPVKESKEVLVTSHVEEKRKDALVPTYGRSAAKTSPDQAAAASSSLKFSPSEPYGGRNISEIKQQSQSAPKTPSFFLKSEHGPNPDQGAASSLSQKFSSSELYGGRSFDEMKQQPQPTPKLEHVPQATASSSNHKFSSSEPYRSFGEMKQQPQPTPKLEHLPKTDQASSNQRFSPSEPYCGRSSSDIKQQPQLTPKPEHVPKPVEVSNPPAVLPPKPFETPAPHPEKRKYDGVFAMPAPPPPKQNKHQELLFVNKKPFLVMSILGRGGTSKVYQVFDQTSEQVLALKIVDLDAVDEATAQIFLNEVKLLESLQTTASARVIKLVDYEVDDDKGKLYILMEKGESDLAGFLKKKMKEGPLEPFVVKYYWQQMLQAVHMIHKQNIVHSDLKPANFLLVSGNLKLIDFGIATAIQADMTSVVKDSNAGTYNYMSPEAIQVGGHYFDQNGLQKSGYKIGVKSDVWSLGCILYNLVYGRTPFQQITQAMPKLQAIINPNHQIPFSDCGDSLLLNTIQLCLQRDPKKRPSIDDLLKHPYLSGRDRERGKKDVEQILKREYLGRTLTMELISEISQKLAL